MNSVDRLLTAIGDFQRAAESFEKAMEIGPQDAYLPLWRYLAKARAGDAASAAGELTEARDWLMGDLWPRPVYALLIDGGDPGALKDKARITGQQETRELQVQADFFLAQFKLLSGDPVAARRHFQAVLAAGIGHLHHTTLARFELKRLPD